MGLPAPTPDSTLSAPLDLPAVVGKPLTTQGGITLDDGSDDVSGIKTLSAAHFNANPTTPVLPANPLVSGTVYQNTSGGPITIALGVSSTVAGTAQWALGSTNAPATWGPATTTVVGSVIDKTLTIPNGWYYSLTVTGTGTIGVATVLGE